MELKLYCDSKGCRTPKCFNRTFMELKLERIAAALEVEPCFNRTFMELKFLLHLLNVTHEGVLIVPLWN